MLARDKTSSKRLKTPTIMKAESLPSIVVAAAALLASACFNLENHDLSNPRAFSYTGDAVCVCGGDGDLSGCFHEKCRNGENNPDNEACVCGGLSVTQTGRTQTSAGADSPSKLLGESQILYLAGGNTVRGVLVADNGLAIELRSTDGSTRTYTYDELDPRSVYRLMKGRAPKGNAAAQIEVGNYARDVGYYAHARRHYQQALDDDPAVQAQVDEAMATLRQAASQAELTAASDALTKGDSKTAEEHIAVILTEFPDEPAATSAAAMLGDMQAREASTTRSAPDRSAEVTRDFAKAQKAYDKAVALNREGLLNTKKQSSALKSFGSAIESCESVQKDVASVLKKNPDSAPHRSYGKQLDGDAVALMVATNLDMVSIYMTRSDYQSALQSVNHALAVDPGNAEARQARARIETASSDDGWGWGYGRLRPRPRSGN